MIIVTVRLVSESVVRPSPDCFRFQLVTRGLPFLGLTHEQVLVAVPMGRRPLDPYLIRAPGMSPAVWKIAERCWHEKARERPEVNVILKNLENLANPGPGVCTRMCSYQEWAIIDPRT
jgi:hypothetical protein